VRDVWQTELLQVAGYYGTSAGHALLKLVFIHVPPDGCGAMRHVLLHDNALIHQTAAAAAVGVEAVWQPKRVSEGSSSSSNIGYNQAFEQVRVCACAVVCQCARKHGMCWHALE
jgi:hypothetical protein